MARPFAVTDDEIIAAAKQVIARRGPDSFTLSEVAREVGLTRAAITFRFKSTRDLKLRALEDGIRRFQTFLAGLDLEPGGNGLLALAAGIGVLAGSSENVRSFMAVHMVNFMDEELLELERLRGRLLKDAIASVMPETTVGKDEATVSFSTHLTGTLIAWQAQSGSSALAFVVDRTKVWLRLAQIPFNDRHPTLGDP